MYKNTRSTSRTSVYRIQRVKVKINHGSYLKEIYECSKIIFVGRRIISQELFGKLPTTNYSVLIASNKKYLLKHGYASRYIDELPDWFLFHPRIDLLIKGLSRDFAQILNIRYRNSQYKKRILYITELKFTFIRSSKGWCQLPRFSLHSKVHFLSLAGFAWFLPALPVAYSRELDVAAIKRHIAA